MFGTFTSFHEFRQNCFAVRTDDLDGDTLIYVKPGHIMFLIVTSLLVERIYRALMKSKESWQALEEAFSKARTCKKVKKFKCKRCYIHNEGCKGKTPKIKGL